MAASFKLNSADFPTFLIFHIRSSKSFAIANNTPISSVSHILQGNFFLNLFLKSTFTTKMFHSGDI